MEYFNASDASQWDVIKSLINECDYYVLIIAGRYGSIDETTGISFTQKEYEYAISQGVPVISFVHKCPELLPVKDTEKDAIKIEKLEVFKQMVQKKLFRFWTSSDDLASQVVLSLTSEIKAHPRMGWVKANGISSEDATRDILRLREENESLKERLKTIENSAPVNTDNLAQGNDLVKLRCENLSEHFEVEISWNEIVSILAPYLMVEANERTLLYQLSSYLITDYSAPEYALIIKNDFQIVKVQLFALGLIEESVKKRLVSDTDTYWKLTPYGKNLLMKLKAIRKK